MNQLIKAEVAVDSRRNNFSVLELLMPSRVKHVMANTDDEGFNAFRLSGSGAGAPSAERIEAHYENFYSAYTIEDASACLEALIDDLSSLLNAIPTDKSLSQLALFAVDLKIRIAFHRRQLDRLTDVVSRNDQLVWRGFL